jgi:biotin carboxyl carrier protein
MTKIYNVQIEGKTFEVILDDLDTKPIKAIVNGTEVMVTPIEALEEPVDTDVEKKELLPTAISFTSDQVLSPLPGKIIDVFIKVNDAVEKGQVILIIEAMKMKNSIRSTRSGKVKEVHVRTGDNVTHKQLMVEFTE